LSKKISIVAIYTDIFNQQFASKLVVNVINVSFLLLCIINLNNNPAYVLTQYMIILCLFIGLRCWLSFFKQICGHCRQQLPAKIQGVQCSKCSNYNVYDPKDWKQREFDTLETVKKTELTHSILEIFAVSLVLCLFITPLVYYSNAVLNQSFTETLISFMQILAL